jgi:hypothetical protein
MCTLCETGSEMILHWWNGLSQNQEPNMIDKPLAWNTGESMLFFNFCSELTSQYYEIFVPSDYKPIKARESLKVLVFPQHTVANIFLNYSNSNFHILLQDAFVSLLSIEKNRAHLSHLENFYSLWYPKNLEFSCTLLCTLLKIILQILQYLRNSWRYLKNSNGFEFSMTRAFITGSFAEKYWTNTVHC